MLSRRGLWVPSFFPFSAWHRERRLLHRAENLSFPFGKEPQMYIFWQLEHQDIVGLVQDLFLLRPTSRNSVSTVGTLYKMWNPVSHDCRFLVWSTAIIRANIRRGPRRKLTQLRDLKKSHRNAPFPGDSTVLRTLPAMTPHLLVTIATKDSLQKHISFPLPAYQKRRAPWDPLLLPEKFPVSRVWGEQVHLSLLFNYTWPKSYTYMCLTSHSFCAAPQGETGPRTSVHHSHVFVPFCSLLLLCSAFL